MQAGRLHSLWLKLIGFSLTGLICVKAVFRSMLGELHRDWIRQTIFNWIKKLQKLVHLDVQISNPHGVELEEGRAYIAMANHSSIFDIPISFLAFPNASMRMLAKKELSKIPFMGKAMKKAEFPFIDRKNRQQAIRDLAYAKELMETGIMLWIAPEGTRSKDGQLQAFKKGGFITAIESGATIIPLIIENADSILPRNSSCVNLNQTVKLNIGKPVDATEYTMENKEALIECVHQQMKRVLS